MTQNKRMTTRADEEPIRLSSDRIQNLKERMRAASVETVTASAGSDLLEPFRLEYEARCAARAIIHEHCAYELSRGAEWQLALSVLARSFDCAEYNFEDQIANSMLGVDSLILTQV